MEVRFETLPPEEVLACRRTGPYLESAPEAWRALWDWLRRAGLAERVRGVYGYGLDNPEAVAPAELRYDACVALEGTAAADAEAGADAGIERRQLPGGRYAVTRLEGSYSGMPAAFGRLFREWLPASGEIPELERPCLEIYLNDPGEVPEAELLTDLCLPIKA